MDANQSTRESRRPYRLSKRRTIDYYTDVLGPMSPKESTELLSMAELSPITTKDDALATETGGESRSRHDSRQKIRAHLFGSSSDSIQRFSSDEEGDGKNGLTEVAKGVRDRINRTSSSISRRSSIRLSRLQTSHSQSRLSLLLETSGQEPEDEDEIAKRIKEKAMQDHFAAMNHVSSPVDEDKHVDSICSPIRRRSLLTPGIATRTPNDILRKPPSPTSRLQGMTVQEYYYNPNLSSTSPLSRLAALDLTNPDRLSPIPRVSTPSDLNYTQLGGLKLGTLRITNGTSSPVPSRTDSPHLHRRSSPGPAYQEDYFNSQTNQSTYDDYTQPTLEEVRRQIDEDERNNGLHYFHLSNYDHVFGGKRSATPLRREYELPSSNPYVDEPRSPTAPKNHVGFSSKPPRVVLPDATKTAAVYMTELSSSPFESPAKRIKAEPQAGPTTEKIRSYEDDEEELWATTRQRSSFLYDTEEYVPASEPHGSPLVADDHPDSSGFTDDESADVRSSTRGSVDRADETAQAGTNTDSGYSSSASLRSLKTTPKIPTEHRPVLKPALKSSSRYSQLPFVPRTMPQSTDSSTTIRPVKPSPATAPPTKTSFDSTFEGHTSDSSAQTVSELPTIPGSSVGSADQLSAKARKLRKPRPISLPLHNGRLFLPMVHEIPFSQIPPVLSDVASRHTERVQYFPLLEHTFPNKHYTDLRASTSSPELIPVPIRFPSPTRGSARTFSSHKLFKASPRSSEDESSNWIRRMPARRKRHSSGNIKSERQLNEEYLADTTEVLRAISDFGTVSESLGGSPYDMARPKLSQEDSRERRSHLSHPHQMSVATRRARTRAEIKDNEDYALEMNARRRSRSLARAEEAGEYTRRRSEDTIGTAIRPGGTIPSLPSTPSILSPQPTRQSFNDRGGVPGKLLRPQSLKSEAPPATNVAAVERLEKEVQSVKSCPEQLDGNMSDEEILKEIQSRERSKKASSLPAEARKAPRMNWDIFGDTWSSVKSAEECNDQAMVPPEPKRPPVTISDLPAPTRAPPPPPIEHTDSVMDMPEPSRPPPPPPVDSAPSATDMPAPSRPAPPPPVSSTTSTLSSTYSIPQPTHAPPPPPPPPAPVMQTSTQVNHILTLPSQTHKRQSLPYKSPSRPFHTVITPPSDREVSTDRIQHLSGRYDGGLAYGYEAGLGVGGSAGTRSGQTDASRQGIDMSKDWGIDFSDVPIFVTRKVMPEEGDFLGLSVRGV
ncbi:MAG: hypothetical protein MMC33_008503 [Icmadophila ericetorum]|nr:hypothetical protein [Icmadophila ericetorum]